MQTRLRHVDVPVGDAIRQHGVAAAIGMKHVASVLYTYRCTLACKHCCFYSGPHRPAIHVGLEDGLEYLRQLHATDRVIHIAGGEALMYYDDVLALCRAAGAEGVCPHFIETNTTWCISDDTARSRLSELRDAGVLGLLLSADPYHQAACPPDRYLRCLEAACEVFGDRNVAGARLTMAELEDLVVVSRDQVRLREYATGNPPCLTARAGDELAPWFPDRPVDELASDWMWHGPSEGMTCREQFEPEEMWEIHIDPHGNIQTCCGVIIGSVKRMPLGEYMRTGFAAHSALVAAVHRDGPLGLLPYAVERGYEPKERYPQKCGMCWEIRRFLRPFFPEAFGPAEVYEP